MMRGRKPPMRSMAARDPWADEHCSGCGRVTATYGTNHDGAPILCLCPWRGKFYHFLSDAACGHYMAAAHDKDA